MVSVFLPLFVAVAAAMVGLGIIAPILPEYVRSFGATGAELGLAFASFPIARFFFAPLAGQLSDRMGRKRLISFGLGIYTLVSILYAVAGSLWQIGIIRSMQGIASVLVTPIAQAYVGDLTPPGREGRTMNIFYTSIFVGYAVGPLLGGYLAQALELRAPFYAMGFISFLALIGVVVFVPEDASSKRHTPNRLPLRQVLRVPAVEAIEIYMATRGFWLSGFNAFWPLFAAQNQFGRESIGMVLTVYLASEAAFQIPCGYLADRFPRPPQIALGGIIAPLVLFLLPAAGSLGWALALAILMGVASALGRASIVAIRTQHGRIHGMGTLAGIQDSSFAVGQALGPIVEGLSFDLAGASAPMYLGGTMGLLGAMGAMRFLSRTNHDR